VYFYHGQSCCIRSLIYLLLRRVGLAGLFFRWGPRAGQIGEYPRRLWRMFEWGFETNESHTRSASEKLVRPWWMIRGSVLCRRLRLPNVTHICRRCPSGHRHPGHSQQPQPAVSFDPTRQFDPHRPMVRGPARSYFCGSILFFSCSACRVGSAGWPTRIDRQVRRRPALGVG
jgi:hypothetical protein